MLTARLIGPRITLERADDEQSRRALQDMARRPEIAATFGQGTIPSDELLYAIKPIGSDCVVGGISFGDATLGFFVGPEFQKRGFATESVTLFCTALSRAGVACVNAYVVRENTASRRVCERAGFVFSELVRFAPGHPAGGEKLLFLKRLSIAAK